MAGVFENLEEESLLLLLKVSARQKAVDESKPAIRLNIAKREYNQFILESQHKYIRTPEDALKFENIFVINDFTLLQKSNRQNFNTELNSINSSLNNIKEALDAYCIDNYDVYKGVIKTCSHYDKRTGLPLDRVTAAFNALEQTLRDKLTPELDDYNKEKYQLRKSIVKNGAEEYKKLQHQAMQKFIKEEPNHYFSKIYIAKNPQIKIEPEKPHQRIKKGPER